MKPLASEVVKVVEIGSAVFTAEVSVVEVEDVNVGTVKVGDKIGSEVKVFVERVVNVDVFDIKGAVRDESEMG